VIIKTLKEVLGKPSEGKVIGDGPDELNRKGKGGRKNEENN
jgi:hypothetical protein